MTRQEANLQILNILLQEVLKYPGQGFSQILFNTLAVDRQMTGGWVDEFYLEPKKLLERMQVHDE